MGWRPRRLVTARARRAGWLLAAALVPLAGRATDIGAVIQVSTSSPVAWRVAVNNARNLEAAIAPRHIPIEIIAFGRGVLMLRKTAPLAHRLLTLPRMGIVVEACLHSMHRLHLRPSQMSPVVHYVTSGVAEIVRREQEGWSYISP